MISVIVPVYNVEGYLVRCLDSITGQTYRDLEIILVDDGSSDRSGRICDECAKKDSRVRVFHTVNRGLSEARNLGVDFATGEYIGFVDADDWIEPDMYEKLLQEAERSGADVVGCGVFREYTGSTREDETISLSLNGEQAIRALLDRDILNAVWNKLWRRNCFERIRFPKGRIYEDVATTYRLFAVADKVRIIPENKYHYCFRDNCLSQTCDMKNLVGLWLSFRERYQYCKTRMDGETAEAALRFCAKAIARTWARRMDCSVKDRAKYRKRIHEMNLFVRKNFPLFGCSDWDYKLRLGIFFAHFESEWSFLLSWLLRNIYVTAYFKTAALMKTVKKVSRQIQGRKR